MVRDARRLTLMLAAALMSAGAAIALVGFLGSLAGEPSREELEHRAEELREEIRATMEDGWTLRIRSESYLRDRRRGPDIFPDWLHLPDRIIEDVWWLPNVDPGVVRSEAAILDEDGTLLLTGYDRDGRRRLYISAQGDEEFEVPHRSHLNLDSWLNGMLTAFPAAARDEYERAGDGEVAGMRGEIYVADWKDVDGTPGETEVVYALEHPLYWESRSWRIEDGERVLVREHRVLEVELLPPGTGVESR